MSNISLGLLICHTRLFLSNPTGSICRKHYLRQHSKPSVGLSLEQHVFSSFFIKPNVYIYYSLAFYQLKPFPSALADRNPGQKEFWIDKITCNGDGKVGHCGKFWKRKEKEGKDNKKDEKGATTLGASTKGIIGYLQRSASFPTASNCTESVAVADPQSPTAKVIRDCGAASHLSCS